MKGNPPSTVRMRKLEDCIGIRGEQRINLYTSSNINGEVYEAERWAVKKCERKKLDVTEMKMLIEIDCDHRTAQNKEKSNEFT